jgi:hypothetical protein
MLLLLSSAKDRDSRTQKLLVIIHNLNFVCVPFPPNKTETPLLVDSNAVPSLPVSAQCLQTISGGRRQVANFRRAIQLPKLAPRDLLDCSKAPARLPLVKSFGLRAAE